MASGQDITALVTGFNKGILRKAVHYIALHINVTVFSIR